ncbi:MAG TPA: MFS transporter [Jiangellaceae bacterium]|nr:MFS transporter [Jiangellaceae bacterium]
MHRSSPTSAVPPPIRPGRRRWLALGLLAAAQFMLILDVTVVNVALPSIATDLGIGREAMTWVITAYVLTFGGLMLLGGRLADVLGRRRMLLAGLAVFTAASLAAGLASGGPTLIGARVGQGVGAALLSPAALSILTTTFHGSDRNRALGVWAAIGGSGAAVGVLLGGILASGPGWEWIFFVNVPVGAALLVVLAAILPAYRPDAAPGRPDVAGALVVTAATAALVYGLVNAGEAGWGSRATLVPLAVAGLFYLLFTAIEQSVRNPLVRLDLFRQRPVVSGTFVMLTATALLLALFFLSSLYLQHALGFSPLRTGALFLPVAVAITAGAHLASRLVGVVGGRPVGTAAFLAIAGGAAMLTRVTADSDAYLDFLPWFVIAAAGLGAAFVVATTTTLSNVAPHEAGLASGLVNTFHEVGGAIGVALASAVAAASIGPGPVDTAGFAAAYLVCAGIAAAAALIVTRLVPAGRITSTAVGHGHGH